MILEELQITRSNVKNLGKLFRRETCPTCTQKIDTDRIEAILHKMREILLWKRNEKTETEKLILQEINEILNQFT